jgi:acyl carrier protein
MKLISLGNDMQVLQKDKSARYDQVLAIVVAAMREIVGAFGQPSRLFTGDTPLYGGDSELDSLSLVLLVSAIEETVHDRFGLDVVLASESAMSMRHSPYRTVGTLVRFIEAELAAA